MDTLPTISHDELTEIASANFPNAFISLGDLTFCFTSRESLSARGKFLLRKWKRRGLLYSPQFNCNKFSVSLISSIYEDHGRNKAADAESIALGELRYEDREVGPHSLVWYMTPDREIEFFQAQTATFMQLDDQEKDSAWLVYS